MKGFNFFRWLQLNIFLPLTPLILRLFIVYIGKAQNTSSIKIFEAPEILFFSIVTCIVSFNIDPYGKNRNIFEHVLRTFLMIIMVMDFVLLAMIYSENTGPKLWPITIAAGVIPMIIAPLYKLYSINNKDNNEGEEEEDVA